MYANNYMCIAYMAFLYCTPHVWHTQHRPIGSSFLKINFKRIRFLHFSDIFWGIWNYLFQNHFFFFLIFCSTIRKTHVVCISQTCILCVYGLRNPDEIFNIYYIICEYVLYLKNKWWVTFQNVLLSFFKNMRYTFSFIVNV